MTDELHFAGVVGRDNIIALWPQTSPLIAKAIGAYNEHNLDGIFSSLLSGSRQLWISGNHGIESILITQIIIRENEKICFLELCSGRGIESIKFLKIIEGWAKEAGCTAMELCGRPGWKKKLKDYQLKKIILTKDLQNGKIQQSL